MSVLLFAHVGVPLSALFLVWIIEFELDIPVLQQAARLGMHLCILAIGATGAVFASPKLLKNLGSEWMVLISIQVVLVTVALAAIANKISKSNIPDRSKALVGVFLGLFAVSIVTGIVVWGLKAGPV